MPSRAPPWPSPAGRSPMSDCSSSARSSSVASVPSPMAYSGPRSEKYTSKTVSNAFQWALLFTSVAASAYLKASRSSSGMCLTASMASRFSVRETGRPARRSSWMNPVSRSSIVSRLGPVDRQLLGRLGDVGLVLEEDVQRLLGLLGVDLLHAEEHEGAGPVEGLRHRRRLLQLQLADGAHDAHDLVGQVLADVGHPGQHDLLLALDGRVVDVQVEAAALERLRQLPGVVGGEEHERDLVGGHRAQLGDRHLVVGEDLQQQRLGLDLDPVDFVDQEYHGVVGPDGLQQRPGEQELLAEYVLLDVGPRLALALGHPLGLDAQELLLVVPLVERLGLVEALVALEADEPGARHLGHRLGQLGLAGARRALDQHGLAEAVGEVDDAGDPLVGEVGDIPQRLADVRDGCEARIGHPAAYTQT